MNGAWEFVSAVGTIIGAMTCIFLGIVIPDLVSDWRYRRLQARIEDARRKQVVGHRWLCRVDGGELLIYHFDPSHDMVAVIADLGMLTEWEAQQILESRRRLDEMTCEEKRSPYVQQGDGNAIYVAKLTWRNPWHSFP